MKLRPHDNITEKTVSTNRHHFIGPFTTNKLKTNSISTKAPTYTGPLVPGCSPQY